MAKYVVLGIGNILLTDEGVGVRVIEALERDYVLPPEVEVIDGGTCGMEMLEQLENLDGLVVVDCVRANQPPATPILLKGDDVPVFFKTKLSPAVAAQVPQLVAMTLAELAALGIQAEARG